MKYVIHWAGKFLKTDFIRVSSWSGVAMGIKMLTSFVSIKVVSRFVGPQGMALVGQFLNSITMLSALGTGCIGQGVTKFIAEYYDEPVKQNSFIKNAVSITLICTSVVSILTIIFARSLGSYIFHSHVYDKLIVLFGISLILYTFNTLIVQILNGFKAFKKYVIVNVVSSILGLALSIFLVIYLNVYGALLNCILSQSVVLGVTIYFVYREPWFGSMFRGLSIDWQVTRKFAGFTLMMLTTSILVPYTQIAVRNHITKAVSLHAAGLWESMNRLSGMYLLLITTSISTYYLPRLSEIRQPQRLRQEILKTMKIVLPFFAITCLFIFLLRDLIIRIVFTKEFLPMESLFAYQMVGDFFKIASWLLAYLFWAKALTRHFIITEIIFGLTFILLATQGVNIFGVQGAVMGYALNYLIYFIVLVILFRSILANNNLGS